ncbi:MAG: PAS domain-containing sensor histidine kinase, partial [Planctomycetales bacterium]
INRAQQGFNLEDVIGSSAYDYLTPERRAVMMDAVASVFQTGEFVGFQTTVTGPDGTAAWYQTRLGPYRENGEIVGVTSIATNITPQKEAEQTLAAEQQLLRRLLALQENDRRLVAHDIHDGFMQYAVGAHLCAQTLAHRVAGQDKISSALENVESHLQKAIAEGRRLIRDPRPLVLEGLGIVEAIVHLIDDEVDSEDFTVAFTHNVSFDRLEPTLEGAVFRIVQESLNNIRQHGQVDHASVQLTEENGELRVFIRDQGVGFDPQRVSSERFGLRGICERARLFGGTAVIESAPGKGTSIEVRFPLSPPENAPSPMNVLDLRDAPANNG